MHTRALSSCAPRGCPPLPALARRVVRLRLAAASGLVGAALSLLASVAPASGQGAPGDSAVLTGVQAKSDDHGVAGLLLTFDRPTPLYSLIGNGTDQPAVAFAAAVEAPRIEAPNVQGALATVLAQGEGVLTIRFKEASPTSITATPQGAQAIFISFGGTAAAGVADGAGTHPPVHLDPDDDGFEVVLLKYADVSEVVGLLTGEQNIRPNDSFTPQEPAFGSAAMGGTNGQQPPIIATGASPSNENAPPMLGQSVDESVGIDRRLNAIILRGSPEKIAEMKAKIAKLDRPITSVLLETVFVELTDSGAKNIGLNLNNASSQIANLTYTVGGTVSGLTGLKSYPTASLQAAIYAQVQAGHGRIVSKPRISAQSGASAKIITGDAVPILTSITLSGVNGVSQQVQYVTVGVTLQIAPRVSDDGFVTSHIFCEVSSVTGYSQGYPTISQREATTSATVRDGQSFVIGGLAQENVQSTGTKLPGLGSVPLIGRLFNLDQSTRAKTDLYIVVTPHIVRTGAGL